jgi:xanthine dehydrogenase YagS FAD-binding subunit
MKPFEYAFPRSEAEAIELLNGVNGKVSSSNGDGAGTAVLAGGTDLVPLMQRELVSPRRVVDVKNVASMSGIEETDDGITIGALTTLEEMAESPLLKPHASLLHVVEAIHSIQIQSRGTLGGDLCHLPNCWYFRNGYGLFGTKDGRSLVEAGDNRYHAILGNRGPAKFVSASRFAPALIAWGARVRIIGPTPDRVQARPLDEFFVTPKIESQGVTILKPGQLISHVWLPRAGSIQSASFEVLQLNGLDWPQAAAAACVEIEAGFVRDARIVLGHVAPVPWVAAEAAEMLIGHSINEETAATAGEMAVAGASPLSNNDYKVQMTRAAVKRALLRAVGQAEGGL